MNEPPQDLPAGLADRGILDRSQQAARFLDLTRQRELDPDPDDVNGMLLPLVAALLHDVIDLIDDDTRRGAPLDDDDGDVFGDGNGFGAEPPFGG